MTEDSGLIFMADIILKSNLGLTLLVLLWMSVIVHPAALIPDHFHPPIKGIRQLYQVTLLLETYGALALSQQHSYGNCTFCPTDFRHLFS